MKRLRDLIEFICFLVVNKCFMRILFNNEGEKMPVAEP